MLKFIDCVIKLMIIMIFYEWEKLDFKKLDVMFNENFKRNSRVF